MKKRSPCVIALCSLMLSACYSLYQPYPEPYVAVKGKPYYWQVTDDEVYGCRMMTTLFNSQYELLGHYCAIAHPGNFSEGEQKGITFSMKGIVRVEKTIPSFGPFGPYTGGHKRLTFEKTVKVVDENDPLLQKCKKVDFSTIKVLDYRLAEKAKNAVAYDCAEKQ